MESPFLLWQDNNSSSTKPDPTHQQPAPRTRSKKGSKPSFQKKAPQRGLGVAQLERLRIEERFKEVLPAQQTQRALIPGSYGLTGLYPVEQQGYNVVRYEARVGTGFGYPAGAVPVPVPEPPSNQMVVKAVPAQMDGLDPLRCYSDQCEFCVRKKRLFGESSMYQSNCMDFMQMDLSSITTLDQEGNFLACMEKKRPSHLVHRQTKEYQFFPIFGGDVSELANPMVGAASTSASYPSAQSSQLLDLSLKL